jgi:hypothetical protein
MYLFYFTGCFPLIRNDGVRCSNHLSGTTFPTALSRNKIIGKQPRGFGLGLPTAVRGWPLIIAAVRALNLPGSFAQA